MTNTKFEVSPTCPNPQTCTWSGDCVARQLLDHELKTRITPVQGFIVPPPHDAIEALMRAAKCTDSGFIVTLWRALKYLVLIPRPEK